MRTIVLNEPYRLAVREGPVPEPGPGEALVRVRRAGVCGTDLHAFRGEQPYFTYPRVLGHELAVEIAAISGSPGGGLKAGHLCAVNPYLECGRCAACRMGKPNCCTRLEVLGVHRDGGMAEYITVPLEKLIPAPRLGLDAMAFVENQCIGAHAVRRAGIRAGETVLVIGAGPIGLGVVRFAILREARVIVMDKSRERLAFCRERFRAVERFIDAGGEPEGDLRSVTAGDFPTAVFDATGSGESMEKAFGYVAHGGRLILAGLVQGRISFDDPEFHKREMTVMASRNALREDFEHVIRSLEGKDADVLSLITHRAALEDVIGEFPKWIEQGPGVVKAVVDFD